MNKWMILGATLGVLVVAIVLAAMNLEAWLDENRPMIEEQAGSAIGRDVTLGDLGVQIWGGLGVSVEGVRIAEDPAYGDGAFLTLGHGVVRVSVLPAIVGRIEIGELVLESPDIRVIRDARGLSIDSMLASAAEDEPAPEAETGSALALEVSSIRIDDGRLIFEDRTGEETVESVIDGIDLLAEDVGARRPLRFELEARLLGADTPNLTGEGTAGPVLGAGDAPVPFDVTFRVVDLSLADVVRLEDVAASLPPDTTLGGSLDASLEASGVPEDVRFDFALDAGAMDVVYGETFTKPAGVALALTAKGRALPAEASVEAFAFTLAGSTIEGEAKSALDETGAFDATARGRDVPLTGWGDLMPALAGLPVEGRLGLDVRARGSAASERLPTLGGALTLTDVAVRMPDTPPVEKLNARLDLSGAKAELRDTRFEVGGAPMQLEADVADLNAPELRFALDAPVLPLAALGVLEPGSEADDQLRRLRVVGRADLRGEDLEADARFASPEGRIQAIDYRALEGRASMTGTRMQLEEMTMKLLGGEVKLAGVLDQTEAEAPHFDGRVDIDGVRAEELIRARFPAAGDVASGQIHTSMSLSGQSLDDTDALLRSLAGTGRIGISDGVLRDINVAEEVLRGATGVPGLSAWVSPRVREKHPRVFASGDTRFKTMKAGVKVEEGKLRTDDFALHTEDFGLTGGGTVGLDGSLDLKTEFRSSPDLAASLVGVARPTRFLLDDSKRLLIPVSIGGTLTDPKVRADSKFLAESLTRAAVGTATSAIGDLLGGRRRETGSGEEQAEPDAGEAKPAEPKHESTPDPEKQIKKGFEELF